MNMKPSDLERTCLIIKPDGVCKKVAGEIITKLESEGLKLIGMKMLRPPKTDIEEFYSVHKGKPFFDPLLHFMVAGPIIVTAWEGTNAVARVRTIIGATDSRQAAPGTLRQLYGTDNRRNLVHASDSKENALREIRFFFADQEIYEYEKNCWVNR